jgi:hypothetical protein
VSELTPASQALIDRFGERPDVTAAQVANLQKVLRDSPALTDQFNASVAQGHLQRIEPLTNAHAGGEYHPADEAMCLALASLTTPPALKGPFNAGEVTFVLGHELQHGFNRADIEEATRAFETAATTVARQRSGPHDYTAAIGQGLAANRRDEAGAEVAGWNAVVSAMKQEHPQPTLEDIYKKAPGRMADFIKQEGDRSPYTYALKPGLTLNRDLTLSPTPANIEAMGQNFFDKRPEDANLGSLGTSDYINYYGAAAISYAATLERFYNSPRHGIETPRMTVDMARLHLDERLLEENGLNLGRNHQPMPYLNSSALPAQLHHFDHTAETHTYVPILGQTQTMGIGAQGVSPESMQQGESRFFPPTATDDFLDTYCAAAQRGDSAGCTALFEQHMQMPHMQAMQQQGRDLYEAEQQRQLAEQQRLEQERQQALQAQQQQEQARTHSMGMSR